MTQSLPIHRSLGSFKLMMLAIISVDSIRNLPIAAQYGTSLITFYLIAGLGFFVPLILTTAFLAKRYPHTGGSYLWVEAAFGKKWGFISTWLQWVYNVFWYPTIFAFISTTLAILISPHLAQSNIFILLSSLILFWAVTINSCFGVKAISRFSTFSAMLGTLVPMALIIILAIYWLASGRVSATPLTWHALIPSQNNMANLAFFANILFGLLGIDVIAMHGGDVRDPTRSYRRALLFSGLIIFTSLVLSSLALCVVVSPEKIGLISGLIDSYKEFFSNYHLSWALFFIGFAIILGGLGTASSWMSGLARGLQVASASSHLPKIFSKSNKYNMPHVILITQALVFTLLISVFLLFPNINNSYWILSSMTAQFALLYYVLLFAATFKLMGKEQKTRKYRLWIIIPVLTSIVGVSVGFIPPSTVAGLMAVLRYELIICLGGAVFFVPLFFFLRKFKKSCS